MHKIKLLIAVSLVLFNKTILSDAAIVKESIVETKQPDGIFTTIHQEFVEERPEEYYWEYEEKDVPMDSGFKSYEDFNCITDETSKQYALSLECQTNSDGIRNYNGRLCIAIGSYYSTNVGTYVDLCMKSGKVVKCILGDAKSNKDTDISHRYHNKDGSVAEFIVDVDSLDRRITKAGSVSACGELEGEIDYIKVYEKAYR